MKTICITPEEIMREVENVSFLVLLSNETLDWVSGPLGVEDDRLIVEVRSHDGGSTYYDVLGSALDIDRVLPDQPRQNDGFTVAVAESPHECIDAFLVEIFDVLIYEGVTFGPLNGNARWTSTGLEVRYTKEDGLWVAIFDDPRHLAARLR